GSQRNNVPGAYRVWGFPTSPSNSAVRALMNVDGVLPADPGIFQYFDGTVDIARRLVFLRASLLRSLGRTNFLPT
ncbi:MAG: hypothetical protein WAN72_15075, partial [Candidatus Acidiferrales bacterium]